MRRTARSLGTLVAAAALLLSGCGVATSPDGTGGSPTSASPQDAESADEAAGPSDGSPGDLLPTGDDGSPAPTPAPEDPTDDQGEEPELGAPGIPACAVDDLPATALDTIEDIEAGGPYEFPRNDGVRFQNREGILPDEGGDYYREFTVVTPQSSDRGARRIVTGGGVETDPDHWYYTGDHYESFCEFAPHAASS